MLRQVRDVRALMAADVPDALGVCAQDPAANVYVAARILETDLDRTRGALLGYCPNGALDALCWVAANVVPVRCDEAAIEAFAARLRRRQRSCSSVFGPTEQVDRLWSKLRVTWGEPMDIRLRQPLMQLPVTRTVCVTPDHRVRRATLEDVDLVAPAAAAMFTEEIGYAPYVDQIGRLGYWSSVRGLVTKGHSFVLVENGRILFKADIGSVGVGACQIQGVWVDPRFRGLGLAAPALAAVVQVARTEIAPLVTLYVNDYNAAALATYRRVGFEVAGSFTTILV